MFYVIPIIWIFGINGNFQLNLFGLIYRGTSLHPAAILMSLVFLFFAHTARAILWGKDNAISLGIASAYIGMVIAGGVMLYSILNGNLNIRLELIFQYFFLKSLKKNRLAWAEYPRTI